MRLITDKSFDPKAASHVRVDKIGDAGGGLWWVAIAFSNGETKPEGMFVQQAQAMELANELAAGLGVPVKVNAEPA